MGRGGHADKAGGKRGSGALAKPEAEIEGLSTDDMIDDILSAITVPM